MELTKEEAIQLLYHHNTLKFIDEYQLDDMFSVCKKSTTSKERYCNRGHLFHSKSNYCKECYRTKSEKLTAQDKKKRSEYVIQRRKKNRLL